MIVINYTSVLRSTVWGTYCQYVEDSANYEIDLTVIDVSSWRTSLWIPPVQRTKITEYRNVPYSF